MTEAVLPCSSSLGQELGAATSFARVLHCWEVRKGGEYMSGVVKYINIELVVGSVIPSLGKSCSAGWVFAPLQEQTAPGATGDGEIPGNPTWFPSGQHQRLGERLGIFRPLDGWLQVPSA